MLFWHPFYFGLVSKAAMCFMSALADWTSCLVCIFQSGNLLLLLYCILHVFWAQTVKSTAETELQYIAFLFSLACLSSLLLLAWTWLSLSSVSQVLFCCPCIFSARLIWQCIYQHLSTTAKW